MDDTLQKIKAIGKSNLEEYKQYSMLGSGQHGVCFERGSGVRLFDLEGKAYIDCTSQGWALFLGHANEEIRQAVCEQMGELGHLSQNSDCLPRYALARRLAELAPAHLNRVLFTVGGSAAIEAAMKIAVKNVAGARKFICLQDCYHGTSLTTGAASWISTKAAGIYTGFNSFTGIVNDIFIRVPNPYLYRWSDTPDPEDCIDYCLKAARETLRPGVCGPAAGVIVEPLQANGGQIPMPKRYLQGLRRICDEFGCLLIFDELQTYCRIGDYFAANKYEVEPDILCVGKSLGAGFPIAAILIHDRLEGFGPLGEDIHTFSNNAIAQVAALKQLDIIERDHLLENVNAIGSHLAQGLLDLQKRVPRIGDVRQVGLHIGIEFVEDPATKVPDIVLAQTVKHLAQAMGLLLGEGGYRLNILKIKPPFIMTPAEADETLAIFEAAVMAALQKKP
jgi:4-aminobutyrate aminotransferase-like enzyme